MQHKGVFSLLARLLRVYQMAAFFLLCNGVLGQPIKKQLSIGNFYICCFMSGHCCNSNSGNSSSNNNSKIADCEKMKKLTSAGLLLNCFLGQSLGRPLLTLLG